METHSLTKIIMSTITSPDFISKKKYRVIPFMDIHTAYMRKGIPKEIFLYWLLIQSTQADRQEYMTMKVLPHLQVVVHLFVFMAPSGLAENGGKSLLDNVFIDMKYWKNILNSNLVIMHPFYVLVNSDQNGNHFLVRTRLIKGMIL